MKNVTDKPPEQQSLATVPPAGEVARPIQSFDIESAFRLAIEKGAGVEAMTTLMNVRRELNAEAAKKAFDMAMALFQAECPVISKTVGVPTSGGVIAYKFSPFEQIIAAVKPLLQKHGFSYALDTDTESQGGWVIAKCRITHSGGHEIVSTAKFPLGTKTGIMSETQVYAAALTFASRRVFCNAFGIVTAGEDKNGITSKEKPANPSALQPSDLSAKEVAQKIWDLLKPIRGEGRKWDAANQWLWKNELLDAAAGEGMPDLSAEKMKLLIPKLEKHPELKTA